MEEFLGFTKRVCNNCEVYCEGICTCEGNMKKCVGCVNHLGGVIIMSEV